MLGVADLVSDAPFSHFPHCDRLFTLLSGEVWLAVDGAAAQACRNLEPFAFPGDLATTARVATPGQAFNLMWDRRAYAGQVTVRRLAPAEAVHPAGGEGLVLSAVHCRAGRLVTEGDSLAPGDTVIGPAASTAAEASIALVVELRQR